MKTKVSILKLFENNAKEMQEKMFNPSQGNLNTFKINIDHRLNY